MSNAWSEQYDLDHLGLDPLPYLSRVLPLAGTILGAVLVLAAESKLLYVGVFVVFFGVNIAIAEAQKRVTYPIAMRYEPIRLLFNCGSVLLLPWLFEPTVPVWLLLITHVFGCSLLIKETNLRVGSYLALTAAASGSVWVGGTTGAAVALPGAVILSSGVLIQSFVQFLRTRIADQIASAMAGEARFAALYNDTSDLRVTLNPRDATIVDCNRPFFERLGRDKAAVVGRRLADFLGAGDSNRDAAWFERLQTDGRVLDVEVVLDSAEGGVPCELTASSVLEDGRLVHYDLVLRDRSESVRTAEAVHRRSMFLANMSHEIRTPLNGVLGMADLLEPSVTDPTGRRRLDVIRSSGESLLQIIDDILDFTKIEAGKLEVREAPTDPGALLNEVRDLFSGRASERGVVLEAEVGDGVPPWASIATVRVRQVLSNLLSNAIKFAPQGHVTLGLSAERVGEETWLTWTVTDDGIGISERAQARLFAAFTQAHADDADRLGSTGLGLAISRQLVELMQGRISVRSELGVGSTFEFSIPATVCGPPIPAPDLDLDRLPEALSILVADDMPSNREVAHGMLARAGYDADLVVDGKEALDACLAKAYDVVLMDAHMPTMNGFEATRQIRAKLGDDAPLILGLSASALPEDRDRCLRAGMDAVLAKPLRWAALAAALLDRAAPPPEQAEAPSVLNAEDLAEKLGDRGVAMELLSDFRTAAPEYITRIREAVADRDARRLEYGAHRLRGVLMSLSAEVAADAALRLEVLAIGGDLEPAPARLAEFEETMQALGVAIDAAVGEGSHAARA